MYILVQFLTNILWALVSEFDIMVIILCFLSIYTINIPMMVLYVLLSTYFSFLIFTFRIAIKLIVVLST